MSRFASTRRIASVARAATLLSALFFAGVTGGSEFSFQTDILPILSKAGCNSGACHGAAVGQGGFRLSLLGYDPEEDYWNITREFAGRRVDLDAPRQSLLLRKPANEIDHDGGRRIRRDSPHFEKLLQWINDGAPFGSPELKVTGIEVKPGEQLFSGAGETVQLEVFALHSNGSRRIVTDLALYTSNDEGIAEVDKAGLVTVRSPGVTSIMIRYSGQVAAARIATPLGENGFAEEQFPPRNFIDVEIASELRRLRIAPSELSSDAEFFRRIHLDLAGRLPDADSTRAFLSKPRSGGEREEVIARLIESDDFIDFWTMKLGDLLLMSGKRGPEKATATYHNWLRAEFSRNRSWDRIANDLLTAQGNTTRSGPPSFYMLASDPRDMAEYVGRIFLGTQIACARCHAHPADRWTQNDYYEFSAYFTGVTREGNEVSVRPGSEIRYPKSKDVVVPKPLGGTVEASAFEGDSRIAMAQSLVENPLFAKAMVNRVWKHLLGRGLVEPVDDLRPTNPATHPRLLEKLAEEFRAHDFDLRWLVRLIASSRTYQLSSKSNEINRSDDRFYSRAYLKALPAQVMLDAISQATGVAEEFQGQPGAQRAVQLVGAQTESYALDVLGRCSRERNCETSGSSGGGLAQALHLLNGPTINSKLSRGVLVGLRTKPAVAIIDELYLRALSRFPDAREAAYWMSVIDRAENRDSALEDFMWTLLNSREFAFNH